MPVPKRKTSRSRRDSRQSCKFIRPKAFTSCSNCTEPVNPHQICLKCGFYRGRKILATKLDRMMQRSATRRQAQKSNATRTPQAEPPTETE